MRNWVRVAIVAVLVLSSVGAPALGQPIIGNETDNSTSETPNSTDINGSVGNSTTGNGTTASDGSGGGILGGGGLMPSVPGPGDWLEGAIEWIWADIQDGVAGYADELNAAFVGIAAPGEPTSPSSWIMPTGMWNVPAAFYVAATSMSAPLWAAGLIYMFDIKSRQKQREILRTLIYSAFATLTGMVLLGLYFNGINTISTAIAPGGNEFVQNGSGIVQLGLGHIVVLVLMAINAGVVIVGGLIMYGIYMLPLVLFAFFPFIVASKAVPVKPLQSTANLGLTALGMLPLLRIIQSLLLRLADMMIWDAVGLGTQIASLLGTAIILAFALLGLPWIFFKNIETASGLALSTITVKKANRGASTANNAATSAGSRAKSRLKSAAAPYATKARSTANQTAANAKQRAGSRMGGAMLTAKFGRPGSSCSKRSTGTSPSSTSQGSASKTTNSEANSSRTARNRAINRQRRDAVKRRRRSRSDD
ncbi:hypothetical protein [Halalkalicoccus jeotgali]|nr:hypothetical protein [Halalkalicoccus jeotgali]